MAWIGNQWYDPGQEPGTPQIAAATNTNDAYNSEPMSAYNAAVTAAGGQTPNIQAGVQNPSQGATPGIDPNSPGARALGGGGVPATGGAPDYIGTGISQAINMARQAQQAQAMAASANPGTSVTNPNAPSPYQNLPGYNPTQYATDTEAQRLNQLLGGQGVVQTRNIDSAAGRVPPQNMIDFGGGFASNAGLLSNQYAKYDRATADRMLADEMKSSGGGFNANFQNANPTLFSGPVSTNANPSFTGAGGLSTISQPASRVPGQANVNAGGSQMTGGFNGPQPFNPFSGLGGDQQMRGNDPVSQMMNYLNQLRGGGVGGSAMGDLSRFRQATNGFGQRGTPAYNRARTALGYTRWQPQQMQPRPAFTPFNNGAFGQGVNPQMGNSVFSQLGGFGPNTSSLAQTNASNPQLQMLMQLLGRQQSQNFNPMSLGNFLPGQI